MVILFLKNILLIFYVFLALSFIKDYNNKGFDEEYYCMERGNEIMRVPYTAEAVDSIYRHFMETDDSELYQRLSSISNRPVSDTIYIAQSATATDAEPEFYIHSQAKPNPDLPLAQIRFVLKDTTLYILRNKKYLKCDNRYWDNILRVEVENDTIRKISYSYTETPVVFIDY